MTTPSPPPSLDSSPHRVGAARSLHVCLLASALAVLGFKCPGEDPQLAPGGADEGGAGGSGADGTGAGASGAGAGGAGASGAGASGTGGAGAGGSPCVDITSDPDHCGECGRSCSPMGVVDRLCTNGVCTSTCVDDRVNISKPEPPGMDDGCEALGRRVFVTDGFVFADVGGAVGGDLECQMAADAAGLAGTWMAWLSDSTTSPSARFNQASVPYRRLDGAGTAIANDWADLTDGQLAVTISFNELGVEENLQQSIEVWTATTTAGTLADFAPCSEWTSNVASAPTATIGHLSAVSLNWTTVFAQDCDRTDVHLYCFEQ